MNAVHAESPTGHDQTYSLYELKQRPQYSCNDVSLIMFARAALKLCKGKKGRADTDGHRDLSEKHRATRLLMVQSEAWLWGECPAVCRT